MSYEPIRTCCGCRAKKEKKELMRFFAGAEGILKIDERQNEDGRGAYICPKESCFDFALKKKAFYRTLRRDSLQIDIEKLRQMVINMQSGFSG